MRATLHANFADTPACHSRRPESLSPAQPNPQLRNSSVDDFEAALIKARDTWRGRGPRSSRIAVYSDRIAQRR